MMFVCYPFEILPFSLIVECDTCFYYKVLSYETLRIIDYMHMRNFLHRHINPRSFVIGTGRKNTKLMVTEFMRARNYIDRKTNKHISKTEKGFY